MCNFSLIMVLCAYNSATQLTFQIVYYILIMAMIMCLTAETHITTATILKYLLVLIKKQMVSLGETK